MAWLTDRQSVRITTTSPTPSNDPLEGTLFTACPITNLVAINTKPNLNPSDAKQAQSGDYRIIPVSRIQNFQILSLSSSSSSSSPSQSTPPIDNGNGNGNGSPSFTDAVPPVQALDIRALKNREMAAIGKALEGEARRGKGVSQEAQDLFDAFSRTMPARWDGTSIIVADAVSIASPYRVDDCRPLVAGDMAALNRVRKVVSFLFPPLFAIFQLSSIKC